MPNFPIFDNHMHLDLRGDNIEAVKRFQNLGGTHLVLSHMPYSDISIMDDLDFKKGFERTLELAKMVREETDVKVFVTVGPYPGTIVALEKKFGLARAVDIMKGGIDLAAHYAEEKKIIAIGEIGRPHFPVSDEIWAASNDILKYGMERANDAGCAVVLHTESATPETWKELAEMADSTGLARDKVVKHYSPPVVDVAENHGLFPSVLVSRDSAKRAIEQGTRFFMETDYLDDPKRPGAVLALTTVPKRTHALIEKGQMSKADAFTIHKENPEKVYGVAVDI